MTDKRLLPTETEIIGRWIIDQGRTIADDASRRISQLINGYLIDVSASEDGWDRLYRDAADGRYWELTYPESSTHGGGPPRLTNISQGEAKSKYNI